MSGQGTLRWLKLICLVLPIFVTMTESAFAREKKGRQPKTKNSVVAVKSIDGNVAIEVIEDGKVAARVRELDEQYKAALRGPKDDAAAAAPQKPALVVLCAGLDKRKADGLVKGIEAQLKRAKGQPAGDKPRREKGKRKKKKADDGGGEPAPGGAGPAEW
jgi:hypothetical protein